MAKQIFFSLLAALWLSSCSRCSDEMGARGEPGAAGLSADGDRPSRQLTIGIQQQPDTLWPNFHSMMVAEEVLGSGKVSLTVFDEKWRIKPRGATSIPTLKNGGLELMDNDTRMRTTWHLQPQLKWPDGVAVTADDYVFAHKVIMDPRFQVVDRSVQEKIAKISAQGADRRTLVVEWKQIYAYYHNYKNHPVLPRHILEKEYQENPDALPDHAFGLKPLLPGSFTVAEWVRGSHIIVERNRSALGDLKPWFDRIIFRIIPSTSALEANLVSGTIDAVSSGLPLDRVEALQKKHKDSFNFHYTEGLIFEHIACNLSNPILADVRVRRALLYGIDRQRLVKSLFGDRQPVAHSWVPPRREDHNPDVRRYGHDPQKAVQLLQEAGYKLAEDGLRYRDGAALKLTIMTTSGNATRERIEQMLQSDWRKIGVELVIRNQPAKIFFSETIKKRAFPGLAMFSWRSDPLHDSSNLWRCDSVPSEDNSWTGQNYSGWCNEEVTEIHRQVERTLDDTRRNQQMQRQQVLWAEALPVLPLFFRLEPSVTVKRLSGWKPTGTMVPATWNAAEWSFTDE